MSQESRLPNPDAAEQEFGARMDDLVPSYGYEQVPVVGIGGSAGSIEALQEFLSALPADCALALVVVIHLAPDQESALSEVLQRCTAMPVHALGESTHIEAGHVYVVTPGTLVTMAPGRVRVAPTTAPHKRPPFTIDTFFRSLADTHGPHAAAVLLSGMGSDGSLGLKRIKERGGLTLAQDPQHALQPEMPRAAIDTLMVDWVLPVSEMGRRLLDYFRLGQRLESGPLQPGAEPPPRGDEAVLLDILTFLRVRTGRDFTQYKQATVMRRVARRMQVNGVETLGEYLRALRTSPGETGALLQDLLISVTNFFRDPDCFEALAGELAALLARKKPGDPVRAWVAGCATGEEAYSLAMLLIEQARALPDPPTVQVFATDLSVEAIRMAREGLYPSSIEADVCEDRLRRFFLREGNGWRVRRELREVVLFAEHDLLADAAFSRLDLVSCRNLLIYLGREAQRRVLATFHFSLLPGGLMFLGSSEAVEDSSPLFEVVDKKHRLYRQVPAPWGTHMLPSVTHHVLQTMDTQLASNLRPIVVSRAEPAGGPAHAPPADRPGAETVASYTALHLQMLEELAPPSVLVNRDYDMVHLSPSVGRFLFHGGGELSRNLLRVVDPELRLELRAALLEAEHAGTPVQLPPVKVARGEQSMTLALQVAPSRLQPGMFLVQFVDSPGGEASAPSGDAAQPARTRHPDAVSQHFEAEITRLKSQLRTTVEEYETSNEELKSRNEELQATIEELRSAAEELETSREELQSVNEELSTLNHELKRNVDELSNANTDMQNLLDATQVITVFLDRELHITRYSPAAVGLFSLIPSDLRRPLTDLKTQLDYPQLQADVREVLEKLAPIERELQHADGHWYLARVLPYRTGDHRIAGVVLSFMDITERKQAQMSSNWLTPVLNATDEGMVIFSLDLSILSWNPAVRRLLGWAPEDVVGQPVSLLSPAGTDQQGELARRIAAGQSVDKLQATLRHKDGHEVPLQLTLVPITDGGRVIAALTVARAMQAPG